MIIRRSNFILLGIMLLTAMIFFIAVNDSYYTANNEFSFGADSSTYYNWAKFAENNAGEFNFLTIGQNNLGPILLLIATDFDNLALFCINLILFFFAYHSLVKTYQLDRARFAMLLAINPMVIASLLLVNKEILGLFSIAMLACYMESRRLKFLIMACLFAIFTRWEELLVIVIYFFLVSPLNPFRKNRFASISIVVLSISLAYPIFLSPIFSSIVAEGTMESQAETGGGLAVMLNSLQENYLFFVALVPKILANLFGNVFRVFGYVMDPNSINYKDVYNSFIVLGHQIAMLVLFIMMIKKRKINLKSEAVYFSLIYLVFFSISLMVQYRYIFPLYILFCIELSKKRCSDTTVNSLRHCP